ncbi:similar to Saccharomyces cerevisiae YIL068C SEC6 Essential 88kDa subunit of the exocyst complex, which mediates polarized targeting of secretory vesicles to active sites of exocytosis [Maudiozyma barnettii]|uniref:Similar to Saccharomyces cerevisiae YIL068C SEC6 Essential 88kDa subunit of the exocyst complex, which mediates polarized targeting of secretory vesicles to active sites of exocytosis n=1 Tax=Maudiozyma barnettii TaxID=61262 RepID=A0A8H2VF56_9SACH|nr:SNARE-binding exocyst subunit SEC6 [Kazachstania barnettii]CAB4254009.1 similar to Saccharomyces cerevisiae YIL068C SEC6 Essential 88kDa subunit of the exocyst complex, which mediates polarized targeting of secretory vesicles to active sites of exocytosis [Kazachstania barnettii]CAD1781759.1 similar to Saccharomyces cerevisiae YIL068C SEC6 Essential 88kDa subunit of the exocyst complex, which mediates polarized targeting of secretory vesicles to active sites of exocytosis [Kazachstania barnett
MPAKVENLSGLLKNDISLEKIREIKDQLIKQHSTVDYQLSKVSEKYFEDLQDSLKLLNLSQKSVTSIRDEISDINKLSKENRTSIERYNVIFDATKIYEMINNTSTIYEKIVQFSQLVEKINGMLADALAQDALDTGCPDLLHIHYLLTMTRDFQDQVAVMAQMSTDDVQRTVHKLFGNLSQLIEKFDQLLESLIYDIVEIVRSEQKSLAIRLFKILDLEEREDLKIFAVRNIIKKKEIELEKSSIKKLPNNKNAARLAGRASQGTIEYPTNEGLYAELLNGTISTRTTVRGYKNFFLNKLRQSIEDMFVEVRKTYQGEKTFEVLENMDWIFNELMVVKEHLSKYCPENWKIFNTFYELYYEELHLLINELVESEPETIVILDILDFDKTFQDTMVSDFGLVKKDLKSIIGPEQKETLFKDYLNLIIEKMTEWIKNLEKAEFDVFLERSTPPHTDVDGLLFLDGTKTCFQMFNQQVEVAAGSNQAKILVGVIEQFCDLLIRRQKDWDNTISGEVSKLLRYNMLYDEDPQNISADAECPGGLLEYLIAAANDQMRAADYTMAISNKYGALVSKAYTKEISKHMESALDGFADVVKSSLQGLLSIMFDDMKEPYSEIFSKTWYSGTQAKLICDTLSEYLTDIRPQMSAVVFNIFIGNVIDEAFLRFVDAMNEGHSFKTKKNKFLDAMKRDFEIFFSLFNKFVSPDQKEEIIHRRFRIMEYFMDFSCESADEIIETWKEFMIEYPEGTIDFLTAILYSRKDIESSSRKSLIQSALVFVNDPDRAIRLSELTTDLSFISRFKYEAK